MKQEKNMTNIKRTATDGYLITTTENSRIVRYIELSKEEVDALRDFVEFERDKETLREHLLQRVSNGELSKENVEKALSDDNWVSTMITYIDIGMDDWEMSYQEAIDAAFQEGYFNEEYLNKEGK